MSAGWRTGEANCTRPLGCAGVVEGRQTPGAGAGSSIGPTYLVDYGLGESLTHGVWLLRGLVGVEGGELKVERGPVRGHRFVVGGLVLLWGQWRDGGRRQRVRAGWGGGGAREGGGEEIGSSSVSMRAASFARGVCLGVAGSKSDARSPAGRTDSARQELLHPNPASGLWLSRRGPGA